LLTSISILKKQYIKNKFKVMHRARYTHQKNIPTILEFID
jgi:hypothetical protein